MAIDTFLFPVRFRDKLGRHHRILYLKQMTKNTKNKIATQTL